MMRFSRLAAAGILSLSVAGAHAADPAPPAAPAREASSAPVFPKPPRLATTETELARDKLAPDFPARRDAAVKAADELLASPVSLPDGYGSWIYYYACPDDGSTLRMITLTDHECPKCKKHFGDERTVAAYRCVLHYKLEHAALALGWAYAHTGDDKYVRQVQRILLKLADDYAGYPQRLDRWGHTGWLAWVGGRRYVQSLDEAVGAVRLAKAYDLTRNSPAWTEQQRQHVEKDFFRATADSLLAFNQRFNNHQTWYNAGLMAIASVLEDADLVDKVLNMRGGYYYQLRRSVGDDGLWYEGAMVYQHYALEAMIEIVEAGRRLGLPLQDQPRFKALLASPLKVAYPNGQFACINDSDPGGFQMFNKFYLWAWNVYHDPVYAQAAAWGDEKKLAALLGPDARPVSPLETRSIDCGDAGVAILRAGRGDDSVCLFLHYGIHGGDQGGHGHYDKLGITLFANQREWLVDVGRIGYQFKEHATWAKSTVAHNTVVLGGIDQRANTGKLLWLASGERYSACAAESTRSYPGATLRRYVLLTPKLLVDVFDVTAEKPTQMDWLAHAIVKEIKPVEEARQPKPAALGTDNGYQHLADCQAWPVEGTSRWDFVGDTENKTRKGHKRHKGRLHRADKADKNEKSDAPNKSDERDTQDTGDKSGKADGVSPLLLRVWLAGNAGEEIYTATGIGHQVQEKAPCLVRRRHGQRARFVAVYDLSGKGDYVTRIEVGDENLPRVKVEAEGRWREIRFEADGVRFTD